MVLSGSIGIYVYIRASGLRAIPSLTLQRRWFLRCSGSDVARIVILVVPDLLVVRDGFPENRHCFQAATWHTARDSRMSQLVMMRFLQFLDKNADVPSCATTELMVQTEQNMRRFLQFVDKVVHVPVVFQR